MSVKILPNGEVYYPHNVTTEYVRKIWNGLSRLGNKRKTAIQHRIDYMLEAMRSGIVDSENMPRAFKTLENLQGQLNDW